MSEERESDQAGAPVEQNEVTNAQVIAAVERAAGVPESPAAVAPPPEELSSVKAGQTTAELHSALPAAELPSAAAPPSVAAAAIAETAAHAPAEVSPEAQLPREYDGEIRISADHPMAALYMRTPMPPEIRGVRGSGVLIALLAVVPFLLVYTGALALWQAPFHPPSTFLDSGLLPALTSWGVAGATVGFFVGLLLLVLAVGRAGWWAYVIGGMVVAVFAWAGAFAGSLLDLFVHRVDFVFSPQILLLPEFGLAFPLLAAAAVAREVTVWSGAWLAARARKIKQQNAEAIAEYERALLEMSTPR